MEPRFPPPAEKLRASKAGHQPEAGSWMLEAESRPPFV